MAAIRRGLGTVVPLALLSLFTWRELEAQVCGRGIGLDEIDLLQRMTNYSGCDTDDAHIKHFWKMMRERSAGHFSPTAQLTPRCVTSQPERRRASHVRRFRVGSLAAADQVSLCRCRCLCHPLLTRCLSLSLFASPDLQRGGLFAAFHHFAARAEQLGHRPEQAVPDRAHLRLLRGDAPLHQPRHHDKQGRGASVALSRSFAARYCLLICLAAVLCVLRTQYAMNNCGSIDADGGGPRQGRGVALAGPEEDDAQDSLFLS